MKVGILSMQKVMNYGSFLQSFALKKTIENLGNQCEFIDIEQGIIFPELKRTIPFYIKKIVERYLKWDILTRLYYMRNFHNRFQNEFFNLLGVNVHNIKHFDVIIIGSDEVFNFCQRTPWGFTLQLYGKISDTNKVISYAASFGNTTLKDIQHFGVEKSISSALVSMSSISVRDINSFNIVKELTGISPSINIDPVLMFNYLPYVKPTKEKDYIIIYSYPNRIKAREEIKAIRDFAKRYNKRLISIGFYFSWCDKTVIPDPFEVLGYIKGADFIITDTFHGSVMSLKFNRPFIALVRDSNKQKMTSLLSQFKLEDRIVDNINLLENKMLQHINYELVNSILEKELLKSLDYLKYNI